MDAETYAKTAFQWAKALRMLDPSVEIISCGGVGSALPLRRANRPLTFNPAHRMREIFLGCYYPPHTGAGCGLPLYPRVYDVTGGAYC